MFVMPICIYCAEDKGESSFATREHVLPDAFGAFNGALTLTDPVVCDACNAEFGSTIDLYLARDTPIGLARFLVGQKKPDEYKSLGRRATLTHRLDKGRLAGAEVLFNPGDEALGVQPLPQIGFGSGPDGPFKWFRCAALPSTDEIRALVNSGNRYVEFLEVLDMPAMLDTLRGLGIQEIDGLRETAPAGSRGVHRVESAAFVAQTFGRAIAKIAMNYLASQHGAAVVRMAAFDAMRKYIRYGQAMPRGTWWSEPVPAGVDRGQHILAVWWDAARRRVVAEVCFYGTYRTRVVLAERGILMNPPFRPRGHRYSLATMAVEPIPQSLLPS